MITCKGYEWKECVHRGIEKFKEQYPPANTDVWIGEIGHSSQRCAVELRYLRSACGVTMWEDESVYERCANGMKCCVVE